MSPEIARMVRQRHQALRELPGEDSTTGASGDDDTWGLALSGGGIRSATFCFGLLHAFAAQRLLLRFDLLSTVSGGGYIGSMLGRLFHRARTPADTLAIADAMARGNDSWFAWWLRANGRYLVPQGLKDSFFALAVYIRNLLGIHLELGLVGLVFGALLAATDLLGWKAADLNATHWWYALEWAREWLAWVPTLYLLLPVMAAVALSMCWSFWTIPWQSEHPWALAVVVGLCIVASAICGGFPELVVAARNRGPLLFDALVAIVAVWVVGMIAAAIAIAVARVDAAKARAKSHQPGDPMGEEQDGARNHVTKLLSALFRGMAWIVLAGALDRAAWWLAFEHASWENTGYALAIVAAILRVVLSPVSGIRHAAGGSKTLITLLGWAGRALTFCLFVWWVAIVHRAASSAIFLASGVSFPAAIVPLTVIAVIALVYMLGTGTDMRFLNLSSLHGFYRARLVRSYLGSVNPWRFLEGDETVSELGAAQSLPRSPEDRHMKQIDEVDPRDDLPLHLYEPHRNGGPVHLLNVCLNETTDPRGGLFNRDRRGRVLTVGPEALMRVGRRDWQKVPAQRGENLTLGSWMAISGAAVSPGLGSMTRGGISALAMFAGARLGYWWDSRSLDPAQSNWRPPLSKVIGVVRETFGIFGGPNARDWYLTDGGHFENTGAYALLSERTRVIVVADCGADPQYGFHDLENLVRKARIDLQADIEFLKPKVKSAGPAFDGARALAARFGSLNDLASNTSDACFALASIAYGDREDAVRAGPSTGYLILVKPNLCSGLPVDLFNFKADNPEFPQQSTADQFFDEAQWESYFQLGNALGQRFDRRSIAGMLAGVPELFERDDGSPVGGDEKRKSVEADGAVAAVVPSSRLPARVATAAASVVGLGAVSAMSVALWQAIEAVKTAHEQQVKDERAALKELTDLWAKLTPDPATRAATANALAATLARVSDTLCPNGDAGWFNRSPLAVDLLNDTLKACGTSKGQDAPRACEWLTRAADRNTEGPRFSCLMAGRTLSEQQFAKTGCSSYWAYDYGEHALAKCAHPVVLAARKGDAVVAASSGTPDGTRSPTGNDEAHVCDGRSVMPMVYGTRDLASLQGLVLRWQGQGITVEAPRDLESLALASGRTSPSPVEATTIRYRDGASLACAQQLARIANTTAWRIEATVASRNAPATTLEVWVAPGSLTNPPPPGEPLRPTAPPSPPPPGPGGASAPTRPASQPTAGPQPPAATLPRGAASTPGQTASVPTSNTPAPPPSSGPAPSSAASVPCAVVVVQSCGCSTAAAPPSAASPSRPKNRKTRAKPLECTPAPASSASSPS